MAIKQIRTEAPPAAAVYVATQSFYTGGLQVIAGQTVAAGHPLLKGRAGLFQPFEPTWQLPAAAPGSESEAPATPASAAPAAEPGEAQP